MGGFGFTEEQEMFRREVQSFARRELAPGAKERAKKEDFPYENLKKLGDAGFLGISVPEEYGGQHGDWISVGIVVEELSKVDMLAGLLPLFPNGAHLMLRESSEEVRKEWIPPLVTGDKLGCFALTEPDCGSDAVAMQMKAVRDGDYYVLNGEKTSVTLGMPADMATVFAKTDPAAGARGITCFIIPLTLPGISRSRFSDMGPGWKPISRASFIMDNVRVPSKYLIGGEGKGFYLAMGEMDFIRIGMALAPLAQAQTSLTEAIDYAKQRTAFGRPIAKFEGVSFKLAEAATTIEAARLLCYRTLWLMDQGLAHTKETAMCKWWCPQVAVRIIHDCLLVFGHVGYCEDYPVEQRLRDAIGFEIGDGTADIMKIIIARELLGREFLPY